MRRLGGPFQEKGNEMLRRSAKPSRSCLMILRSRHSPRIARIEAGPANVEVSAQNRIQPDASLASVLSARSSR